MCLFYNIRNQSSNRGKKIFCKIVKDSGAMIEAFVRVCANVVVVVAVVIIFIHYHLYNATHAACIVHDQKKSERKWRSERKSSQVRGSNGTAMSVARLE